MVCNFAAPLSLTRLFTRLGRLLHKGPNRTVMDWIFLHQRSSFAQSMLSTAEHGSTGLLANARGLSG